MRIFLMVASLWCSLAAGADTLDILVQPKEPIVDENFKVVFEITTEEGTDPIVNFNPMGVEVVAKSDVGVRTRTTYINGRLSTERSLTVVYELLATRPGSAYLRNINVDLNGKKIKHETVRINVLKQARRARDVIVRAELDKEEAFVGESVLVRYYLYNKAPVISREIKRFPKLEKFLKRYHQEHERAERVELNGSIYERRVVYTAQLFASKAGTFKIDPITLGVQYATRGSSPFDTFGFGSRLGRGRTVTVSSPMVELKVKALPVENVPPSFTGLVGKHDFHLELNKNKFVVNEPIELKLKVEGEGALELYEAPKIFTEKSIEEFETSADLVVKPNFTAEKTFLYTFLGRDGVRVKDKRIPFSYFDPKELRFKTEYIDLGDIVIAETAVASRKKDEPIGAGPEKPMPRNEFSVPRTYFEPAYKLAATYAYNSSRIALVLGLLLLGYGLFAFRENLRVLFAKKNDPISQIAKSGLDYSKLHWLVSKLGKGNDMREIVRKSGLSNNCKNYLLEAIDKLEEEYNKNGAGRSYKIPRKNLKELAAAIEG